MTDTINYPDVLGYLTGGQRSNLNVVQLAAALRPRVVRAGRPFEMLVLIQNACDLELEVTATLHLPEKDAKGSKERFLTKAGKLAVRLEPGEVGLVILPLSTLPDIASGADYKIGMDVKVNPAKKDKPNRIRLTEGGGEFNPETLPEDRQALLNDLKNLHWLTVIRGTTLEAGLTVMSGSVGTFADLHPSWTSLWTLRNFGDKRLLLQRLAPVIKEQVLPRFTMRQVLPVMEEYTRKRFQKSRYKLKDPEINMIARLLTLMFLYAAMDGSKAPLRKTAVNLNIARYVDGSVDNGTSVVLPNWLEALLELLNKDVRMAEHPVRAVAHFLYDDLMRDAMQYAFVRIEEAEEFEIGTEAERSAYITQVFEAVENGTLNFDLLYMPLVIGGFIAVGQVNPTNETPGEMAAANRKIVEARYTERTDDNAATFDIASRMANLVNSRYH
jgi:hypothetical protein